jgi:nucleotide-binding universal stress UspA family protein
MFGIGDKKPARTIKLIRESGPAFSLEKVQGMSIHKSSEAAGAALTKRGLSGIRAQAVCVLDYSGSMGGDYQSGAVQKLVERFLGFALQIDADGEVPVIPFASYRLPTITVGVDNYEGVVQRELMRKHSMGSTNLADALKEVITIAKDTDAPLFVGVVTDGDPNSRTETTEIVYESSRYPIFLKMIALRDVPYLTQLDQTDSNRRLLDNVNTKTFRSLDITDEEFAEAMTDEWAEWMELAVNAGILTR